MKGVERETKCARFSGNILDYRKDPFDIVWKPLARSKPRPETRVSGLGVWVKPRVLLLISFKP